MQTLAASAPCRLAAADSACFAGANVAASASSAAPRLPARRRGLNVVAMADRKKVISNLSDWKKEFIGYGLFVEDYESKPLNLLKSVEEKKLLSSVEKAGLLSKLESLGFTLSKIEKLKLLSKAEELGLLSLLESVALTPPGVWASVALPLLVGAVLTPILIPDDTAVLLITQYSLAAVLGLAGVASFGTSIVLGILLE